MPMMTAQTQSDIFAANRAEGHIGLAVSAQDGKTRRARVAEQGSLRVRFPGPPADDLTAVIVNTAGGIAGGDRFGLDVNVENARASPSPPRRPRRSIARSAPTRIFVCS